MSMLTHDQTSGNMGIGLAFAVKAVIALFTAGGMIFSAVGGYYSIINRMDRIDDAMKVQARTLDGVAASVKTVQEEALTSADLRLFCLQSQITNKGWTCPFSEGDPVLVKRRLRPAAVGPPSPGVSVSGMTR